LRRRCLTFCSALAAVLLLTGTSFAAELDGALLQRFGVPAVEEALPPDAAFDLTLEKALTLTPQELSDAVRRTLRDAAQRCRKAVLSVVGLALLVCIVRQIGGEGLFAETAQMLCALLLVLAVQGPLLAAVSRTADTLRGAARFSIVFVPAYAAVTAAGGAAASASVYQAAMLAASHGVASLVAGAFVPLCCVCLNLCIAETIAGDALPRWSVALKKAICRALALLVTVFCALLSLQTALTGAADLAVVKTAKFLVGSFVPVIGTAIADGVQAAQGGIRIIRAGLGTFGIAAAAAVFLPAVLETALLRLGLCAGQALAGLFEAPGCAAVLRAFSQLLEVLMAMLLAMALLMIVSTAVLLAAGGAAR